MAEAMLQVENISRPPLLAPASLAVGPGECGVVMGASGSGKSLLARAIVDLDPNEGDARWQGRSRNAMPAHEWRALVGYVPAEPGWWAEHVGDHFPFPGDMDDLLAAVGLPADAMLWKVSRASSGERQRLAILRALAHEPRALILDEPTSALDEASRHKVEALLEKLLEDGLALLLITHDAAQAARLGARFWSMEQGRLAPRERPAP